MSEDREKLTKNDELEAEEDNDVEAHSLGGKDSERDNLDGRDSEREASLGGRDT